MLLLLTAHPRRDRLSGVGHDWWVNSDQDQTLARVPVALREPARQVLSWLLPEDAPVEDVCANDVLQFVWYTLPVKWGPEQLSDATEATAALLDAIGRRRVAGLLRAPRTAEIQARWSADGSAAFQMFSKATADSGYDPPDTDLLVWGSVMGLDEAGLRSALARVLEQAVDTGMYLPGRSGWRHTQANLVEAWLGTPAIVHAGRTPLEVIHAERRDAWLRNLGPAVRDLVEPLLAAPPAPVPADPAGPLRWLLERVGDGLDLTQAGYLPTAVVGEARHWYEDWLLPGFATRSESDLPPLLIMREFAHNRKLLTKRRRRLSVSAAGRAALDDPDQWWSTVVDGWFAGTDITGSVAEIAASMMLLHGATDSDITALAMEAVAPRSRHRDSSPADQRDIDHALWGWVRPGNSLGFISYGHGLDGRRTLTDTGRAAAHEGLRRRAQAPRTTPG
jgi:hypothetical protein